MAAIDYVDHRSEDAVLHPTMHALASDMSVPYLPWPLPYYCVTILTLKQQGCLLHASCRLPYAQPDLVTWRQTAELFVADPTSAELWPPTQALLSLSLL